MKKIRYYVSALLVAGILVFNTTSCVDDSESQSVTEIREAKSEQLRAEAALANAQAKAEEIRANADAALAQAQAAQAISQAKLIEAEAEQALANARFTEAQTETERSKAQIEKAKADIELAKAEQELKQLQVQTELAIKQAEADLEKLKLETEAELIRLQTALEQLKNDDPILEEAINKYKLFIGQVNGLKLQIAQKELDLTKKTALLADTKAGMSNAATNQIKGLNSSIEQYQKDIAKLNINITNWKTLRSKAGSNVDTEIENMQKQIDNLRYNKLADVAKSKDAKKAGVDKALEAVEDFRDLGTVKYYTATVTENLTMVVYKSIGELNITNTQNNESLKALEENLKELQDEVTVAQASIEKLYTAWQTAIKTADTDYDAYLTAQVAYNKVVADPASTPAQIAAALEVMDKALDKYNKAVTARSEANQAYNDEKAILDSNPAQIVAIENSILSLKEQIADIEDALSAYNKSEDAAKKLEDAYFAAVKEYNTAKDAFDEVDDEIASLTETKDKLSQVQWENGGYITVENIDTSIKNNESSIASLEQAILDAKESITRITETNKVDMAQLELDITDLQNSIEALKVELGVAEKQASSAKTIIDSRSK